MLTHHNNWGPTVLDHDIDNNDKEWFNNATSDKLIEHNQTLFNDHSNYMSQTFSFLFKIIDNKFIKEDDIFYDVNEQEI